MMKKNLTRKFLLSFTAITILVALCISFMQWREHRLERRHQMLHKTVQVDLSRNGSTADTPFLVYSETGKQLIRIDVKSKNPCNIFFIDGVVEKFDCNALYKKYREKYPEKYKNWENIELLIEIRKDTRDGLVFKKSTCFPFSYEKNKAIFNNRPPTMYPQPAFNESNWFSSYVGWCPRFSLPNGYYYATATAVNENLLFSPFFSGVEFGYVGMGSYVDLGSIILDSMLRGFKE